MIRNIYYFSYYAKHMVLISCRPTYILYLKVFVSFYFILQNDACNGNQAAIIRSVASLTPAWYMIGGIHRELHN